MTVKSLSSRGDTDILEVGAPLLSGADGSKPPTSRRGRSGGARIAAAWVAGLTSLAVFGMSGAMYATYRAFDGNLAKVDITGSATPTGSSGDDAEVDLGGGLDAPATHPAMTVLLVGVDDRSTLTPEQVMEASTGDEEAGLADTIILAHIPAKLSAQQQDRAVLVSIPRDSWVRIPGYGYDKINSAYLHGGQGDGGARTLVRTVSTLTGLTIDHYVQVDLHGFLDLSDAIGGVDVCLKKSVDDPYTNLKLRAGPQTLQGADALKFVRQRHGLPQGDLDRITRQQAFLSAALRKVTSAGTLLNPVRLNSLFGAATSSLTVDQGLDITEMRDLAFSMRDIAAGNVEFRALPIRGLAMREEKSVILLNEKKLPAFIAALGEPSANAPEGAQGAQAPVDPTLKVQPSDVRVQVLNGTTVAGTASQVDAALGAKGFGTTGLPSNAQRSDYARSVIKYGPGQAEAARTLAAAVPGSDLAYDSRLRSSVTLIVGLNFTGVKAVAVPGATPTPSPGPSAKPTMAPYSSRFADDASCVY